MTPELKAALREKLTPIVVSILARGRLNQKELEGKLTVRDMGINYRKEAFVDEILTTLQPEIERLVVETRVDELSRVNSHLINLKVSVPAIQKAPKPIGQYVLDRVAQLTQSSQKEGE